MCLVCIYLQATEQRRPLPVYAIVVCFRLCCEYLGNVFLKMNIKEQPFTYRSREQNDYQRFFLNEEPFVPTKWILGSRSIGKPGQGRKDNSKGRSLLECYDSFLADLSGPTDKPRQTDYAPFPPPLERLCIPISLAVLSSVRGNHHSYYCRTA